MTQDTIIGTDPEVVEMIDNMNSILSSLRIKGNCVNAANHRHLAYYDVELDFTGNCSGEIRKMENRAREIGVGIRSKTYPVVKPIAAEGVVRLQVAMRDSDPLSWVEKINDTGLYPKGQTLPFLVGETDEGEDLWIDMAENPHLLIAGGTGSGKSVLMHTLIANAVSLDACDYQSVEVYLVDPKRVEFMLYEDLLDSGPVMAIESDYIPTVRMLEYLVEKMDERYAAMNRVGVRKVADLDRAMQYRDFPYVMVFIDEVNDLMMQDKKSQIFQDLVVRLAQKGRAAGIHLVMATQRPSVDVLTGVIKANFPARIGCRTASNKDSQVILDMPGAETLLGRGDAILRNMKHDRVRFQVAYVDPETVVVNNTHLRGL
jgi:S-DNA-T family DNA segregation ATPase FtsK/SpoIIIE